MSVKVIAVAAMLAGACRGTVREGDPTLLGRGAGVAAGLRMQASAVQIDPARKPIGSCAVPRKFSPRSDLRGVSFRAFERIPVSRPSVPAVMSAWRITAESEKGPGTIVRIDGTESPGVHYAGDGIFAGCDQRALAWAYAALLPADEGGAFALLQLG